MHRTQGNRTRLLPLVVPLAVLTLLLVSGLAAALLAGGPVGSKPAGVNINGDWTISSPVSYSNTTLSVNGSVTIASGGSLTLRNVVLSLSEPSSLAHGIDVANGGALTASGSTFQSATPANPEWMRADAGATLSITGGSILNLGAAAGPVGFVVNAAGATFNGVLFKGYYEALVVSATGVTVTNCTFEQTTSTASTTWVISTSGSSSGFVLTHSQVVDTSMMGGALSVASSSDIENNTFTLNPHGTNPTPVLIGYSGTNGFVNASGTRFVYNTVSGSDVTDFDSSHVTISHNKILNTGGAQYVHDYGIRAQVFNPSGAGIWVNGLTIEYNLISNSTSFGIRLENNVTNAVVAHNNITNISTSPQAGTYNGVQTYEGIYLIRGVTHSLVYANRIDNSADQGSRTINTAGIGLESDISYTTVSNNTVLNTDLGIWVQGDWNDGPGNIGPSLHNTVTGNTIRNTIPVVQTADLACAIQNYDWANYTTITNNVIEGWNMVPSGVSGFEGAAIFQADVYGTIAGNVVNGATMGVAFGYFYGSVGNASYNAVYGNSFNVTGSIIVNNTASIPTPIVNDLNVLNPHQTSNGFPAGFRDSIGSVSGLAFRELSGAYSVTLETRSPVTGALQNFTTSEAWSASAFSARVEGSLGSGTIPGSVSSVNSTGVTYSVTASGPLSHSVSLYPTTQSYSANYTVHVVGGGGSQTFSVSSSTGPAVFQTTATGSLTVTVLLDNWTAHPSSNPVELRMSVATSNGSAVPGIVAEVALQEPTQTASLALGPTNSTGGAAASGLPSGTTVTNVTLTSSNYTLAGYSINSSQPDLLELSVVVVPVGSGGSNNSTPTFPIRFTEHGLGSGATWQVSVTGPEDVNVTSATSTITFQLTNGTYHYSATALSKTNESSPNGTFVIPKDADVSIALNFTLTNPTGSGSGSGSGPGPSNPGSGPLGSSLPLSEVVALYFAVVALGSALFLVSRRLLRGRK